MSKNRPKQIPTSLVNNITDHRTEEKYNEYFFTPACKFIRKITCNWAMQNIERSVQVTDQASRLELPSYSEKQAFESGYRKAMRDLLELYDR